LTPDRQMREFTLSIVSHGQGALVAQLLDDLARLDDGSFSVVLTLNLPEDETGLDRYPGMVSKVIRNPHPRGFGANHNGAFAAAAPTPFFGVLNPDLRLKTLPLQALARALVDNAAAGVAAPLVRSPEGGVDDSVRRFPSVARLARRVLLRQRAPDYDPAQGLQTVDWAAGMFLLFARDAYAGVGGFDERYFMYLEDTDICRRLARQGRATLWQPSAEVVHAARRASRRSLRHLSWHLKSALRFLLQS
jgi:N-acetylglucosaminyl-diphospho-decaprenol L-rhamnosyltransferase